jgi:hypothetical protein
LTSMEFEDRVRNSQFFGSFFSLIYLVIFY